ncbi:hypothetical protein [Streptomyces millisiae]|uniref:Microcin J25-processing protein McjB C-terminal domain-containing protein n=1 Tax=Streptomyces millisiae TaxID=3075542 RepID=A0ABU2LLU2_9ACTN|nr:hypothetical protein [Streptomyces sp. DSM 44918]MDT0318542.1 hypothetical protein [Streptomyces sp. DSM 44918]
MPAPWEGIGELPHMTNSAHQTASLIVAEDGLIDHIRQHAGLSEAAYRIPEDWRYRSPFHLLLAFGRRFTHTPSPEGLIGMPARLCYSNAARYALAHRSEGLVYAEGFALTHAELNFYLPHAWVVRPDGTVLDPTWDDAPGRAYVGIPIADSRLWPVAGGGLLQDFDRTLPLLRNGFPPNALADLGRPLITKGHS